MKNYVWLLMFLAAFGLAGLFWYSKKDEKKAGKDEKSAIDQTLDGLTPPIDSGAGALPGARTDAPSRPNPQVPHNNGQNTPPTEGQNFQPPPPSFDPPQYEPPPYEPPPYDQVPPPPPQKMDEFDNDPVSPPPPMEPPAFNNDGDYVPPPPPDGDDL